VRIRRSALAALAILAVLSLLLAACAPSPPQEMTLATTTSTYDTGLLQAIMPAFEQANNVKVKIVAVGTGQAIALGQKGDADVLLVHDRPNEDKFVADGYGVNRRDVMYNDFVIVGPPTDPAGIKGSKDAVAAMAKIAQAKAVFISRGDNSGTNSKEKEVWAKAGVTPTGQAWYISAGQGMRETLTMTNEKLGYTISDRGTYLARKAGLSLVVLVEGDKVLLNPYGVIAVNPQKWPQVKYNLAMKFVDWITSLSTQETIGKFGVDKYGQPLFFPDSDQYRAAHPK